LNQFTPPSEVGFAQPDLHAAFKAAMRRFAATVTIVTVKSGDVRSGMTATAVSSVTTDPPALLACVNRGASIHANLRMGKLFCVNLLASEHGPLSTAFGGKLPPQDRFSMGLWHFEGDGPPYLSDAQANIFCFVDAMMDYGTHTIFVGKVDAVRLHGDVRPLIYGNGRFINS
jgi:flavin reductase (DIM6/NTAB) family NADH-FMN oxidoreductase RutF